MPQTIGTPLLWLGFTAFVLIVLVVDLGIFHRDAHEVGHREALAWTSVWISLAVAFTVFLYLRFGSRMGLEFLTGYLIEYSLSVDNLFVFLIIFRYFSVPRQSQHRVLFWGILGALIMRAVFILVGAAFLQAFHWAIYLFGGFLVFTGVKMLQGAGIEVHPERNPLVRFIQGHVPMTSQYSRSRFWVRHQGRSFATPLLIVLVVVEGTDLVFAVDSIPAIFAVTRDPFIVYTSNIFAILGLRSLYFLLAAAMDRFHYLKVGLGLVLLFVGVKMLLSAYYEIPIGASLAVVGCLLGASVAASLLRPLKPAILAEAPQEPPATAPVDP